eukprot:scaffold168080_cov30-Tisochrysis_lutea.AAC.2
MMPSMFSSLFIALVSASAVRRKASGERGHPCGTPLATVNGKLRPPLDFMYRIGRALALVSVLAYLRKSSPKFNISSAMW